MYILEFKFPLFFYVFICLYCFYLFEINPRMFLGRRVVASLDFGRSTIRGREKKFCLSEERIIVQSSLIIW